MTRRITRAGLSLLLCFGLSAYSSADDKPLADCTSVIGSTGRGRLGGVDFWILSALCARDFFKGLEYKNPGSGTRPAPEFRKDGRILSLFPEELKIVLVFQTSAGFKSKVSHLPSLSEIDEVSRSLEIEPSWKTGVKLRSAELIAPPDLTTKPAPFRYGFSWAYTLRLRARNVPLTDHLVICVFSPDKKLLARVIFDLSSDLRVSTIRAK